MDKNLIFVWMNDRHSNPFSNALRGILATYRSERHFKVHLLFAFLAVALGVWLDLSVFEWCWVACCVAAVFISELLNTAIEALVDLVSPAYHSLAKKAKDAAAGAVLVAAIFAATVGGMIFFPKLWIYFFG
ncbi:diacylglycerol kinase [Parapedobacter sp. DT-150]|uniref:diacylglycerol kinase n=1 Tax=Parapedobacter sp. DT-150 TaxID=3396162 RepID=UPI003F1B2379